MNQKEFSDTLTVVREMGDSYIVRVTRRDEKSGETTVRTDAISRELFESCVQNGYLTKVTD